MTRHRQLWPALISTAMVTVPMLAAGNSSRQWPPERLRDTGLYADWESKTIDEDNLPFSPQYPLWTDGALKSRWMWIPRGAWIDASDPDLWTFPVGTRLWKEFRFARRAETRFIEHTQDGWRYATYVWNDEESEALVAPERGIAQSVEIRDGVRHAIPSRTDCRACHEGSPARVLGVGALQLSPDRDPNAPHAEPRPPGGVDLRILAERGLVRGLPPGLIAVPPRIDAKTPTARAALGYLHGNCSSCHTAQGELASLALSLQYPLGLPPGDDPPAIRTALGRPSTFGGSESHGARERLCAGDPDRSVLVARMSSRHPVLQMPPLGSSLVDEEAVRLIRRWVAEDLQGRASRHQRMEEQP
jgi:mono/diheme cytochrome c family protein